MTAIINIFPYPLQEESIFSLEDTFIPTFSQDEILAPLLLEEILPKDKPLFPPEEEEKEEQLDIFQVLQEIYEAPPEAGETAQRSGFSKPTVAKHNPFPLHEAAGKGDVAEINKLIREGFNVNAEDARSAIPLVIATIFGHVEAVKVLVKAGSVINDRCYEGHTALHIALGRKQYDVARILIQNGANPKLKTWQDISATTMLFSQFEKAITDLNQQKDSPALQKEVNDIISTLETIAQKGSKQHYLNFPHSVIGAYQIPLSVALKTTASTTTSPKIRERILKLSESMTTDDPLAEGYVQAKNLLSSFPTGKTYTIDSIKLEGGEPFKIMADGHYKHYTTPLAKASLGAFVSNLIINHADQNKIVIFTKVHEIFTKACESVMKAADPLTAKEAVARYLAGETVLLPTQCDKHFIDVIVSKKQELLVIANTGERYALDTGGIMLHDILKPEMIDATFMNKILTNKDRMYMEFYMPHEFGPITKLNTLEMPSQIYGNCTWESHRNAVKGLLYIELRNQDHSPEVAEKQAHEYFKEWDSFHSKYMLEDYLAHDQVLPVNALGDIYLGIQKKKGTGAFTETDSANAKLLMKTLTSDVYQTEFNAWKKSLPHTDLKIVNSDGDAVQSNDHPAFHDPIKYIKSFFSGHQDAAHKGIAHKLAFEAATPLHTAHQEPHAGLEQPHHEPEHF